MKTLHQWFRSGRYSLLGHVDLPEHRCERLGVVIAPPLGWEDICAYRPLRFLARQFAEAGFPALRYDLAGCGNSAGDALDSRLLEAWIQSVTDAADELRAVSGADRIAMVGIRLGAILALAAVLRAPEIEDLILWGPAVSGRTFLRELRAFANVQRRDDSNGGEALGQTPAGFEVGGFLISPETQRDLESLDFAALPPMPRKRVLILTREELAADAKLVRALQTAQCAVEIAPGPGYSAMMAIPHESVPPEESGRTMIQFLAGVRTPAPAEPPATDARVSISDLGGGIFETIYTIGPHDSSMFGILAEPGVRTQRSRCCLLFLNPGATRHIGPNRMWVEAARRWAARGVASLRLDLAGIGESDGPHVLDVESLYQDRLVEHVELAMDSLRSRLGVRQFIAIGLCSGAFWALHAAVRNSDVQAAVLLNPRLFRWDPEVDRLRALRRTVKGLTSFTDWRRLARGEVKASEIRRIAMDGFRARRANSARPFELQMQALTRARAALERHHTRATIIFTEGEPLLAEIEEYGRVPSETDSPVRCIRIPNGGHTFRPLWIQKLAHELIDREIETALEQARAECITEAS